MFDDVEMERAHLRRALQDEKTPSVFSAIPGVDVACLDQPCVYGYDPRIAGKATGVRLLPRVPTSDPLNTAPRISHRRCVKTCGSFCIRKTKPQTFSMGRGAEYTPTATPRAFSPPNGRPRDGRHPCAGRPAPAQNRLTAPAGSAC